MLPTLSVGRIIRERNPAVNILYLGSTKSIDSKLVREAGFSFIGIPAGKWRRYFDLRNFGDIFITCFGFVMALVIIAIFWPNKIFIKGGYVGVPVGLAAWVLRRPIILHESDSVIGVANRILIRFANQVCVSFPPDTYLSDSERSRSFTSSLIYTGIPINNVFYVKEPGSINIPLIEDKPLILVMGGSQGARAINKVVKDALPELLKDYQVVHLVGGFDYQIFQQWVKNAEVKNYYLFNFLPNTQIASLMKQAAVIISRAGATTIAEIAAVGKPVIFIPLPSSANNHQYHNAKYLADRGAAIMIDQNEATAQLLIEKVNKILKSDLGKRLVFNITSFAKKDAAEKIADILIGSIKKP